MAEVQNVEMDDFADGGEWEEESMSVVSEMHHAEEEKPEELSDSELRNIMKSLDDGEEDPDDDAPTQTDPRARKVKFLLLEFAQQSTMHGVSHMGDAYTVRIVVFWGCLLVLAGMAFAFLFYDTLAGYMLYGTNVQIKMESSERYFPSVTICNISPYKASGLKKVEMLAGLLETFQYAVDIQKDTLCEEHWNYAGVDAGKSCKSCSKVRGRTINSWCWPTMCKDTGGVPPGYASKTAFCRSYADKTIP